MPDPVVLHNTTCGGDPYQLSYPSCLWMLVGILKWVEFKTKLSSWSCWLMPACGEKSREAQVSCIKQGYATGNLPEGNISLASPPVDSHAQGETMPHMCLGWLHGKVVIQSQVKLNDKKLVNISHVKYLKCPLYLMQCTQIDKLHLHQNDTIALATSLHWLFPWWWIWTV